MILSAIERTGKVKNELPRKDVPEEEKPEETLLDVTGLNFGKDGPLLVTLALTALPILDGATDTAFTAKLRGFAPGSYLMTVTTGPGQGHLGTLSVTLTSDTRLTCEEECLATFEEEAAQCGGKDKLCLLAAKQRLKKCLDSCQIIKKK